MGLNADSVTPLSSHLFAGGGACATALRTIEWDDHPLGPPEQWPAALRTTLSLCLASPDPICILWGSDRVCFYNDACAPYFGSRHPASLGETAPRIWPDAWERAFKPLVETVESGGQCVHSDTLPRQLFESAALRSGLRGSLTPLRDDAGRVGGIFALFVESRAGELLTTTEGLAGEKETPPSVNKDRFHRLVDSIPVPVYSCDVQGRITHYNTAAVALWGRAPQLDVDRWCGSFRLLRPDGSSLPIEQSPTAAALRGEPCDLSKELIVERTDGTRRHVLSYPQPLRDAAGRVTGALNILVDITDRRVADAALATTADDPFLQVEALQRLHALSMELSGSHDRQKSLSAILSTIVELHGADHGLLSLHDGSEDRLIVAASVGFDDAALAELGKIRAGPQSGASGAAFARRQRTVVEDTENDPLFRQFLESTRRADFRAVHATPILGVLSVYFRKPRRPAQREFQLADMCARHAAATIEAARFERALRESEQRFMAFMEHLPGAAWIKDLDGKYIYGNPECGRVFPVSAGDLIGKTDEDIFALETAHQFRENDRRAVLTGRAVQAIELLRHPDGLVHHSIVNKFPMPGPDGRTAFVGGIAFDITDRVRAEQSLRESESRFRAVAMNAPAAIFIKDFEGRYTLANPLACQTLGRPDGVVGLTDHELMPSHLADLLRQRDIQVVSTGRAIAGEERVGADGSLRTFLSVKFPLTDAAGHIAGVCGVAIDVTERDQAQRQRREAAALLEGCIDALTSHIAILDRHGNIIKVNQAWRRFAALNGLPSSTCGVGANYLEACAPRPRLSTASATEAAYALQGIRNVIDGTMPSFVLEYACHSPTERRWFVMHVTRFGEHESLRVVIAHEDVTDRREVEQIIVRNAERLRLANEAANLGTWDLNLRTNMVTGDVRANDLFCRKDIGEVPFDQALQRVHPDDRPHVKQLISRALDPGGDGRYEVEYRAIGFPDGAERWHRANGQATFESGVPVRFIGTLQDVTDRKRAEEALRRSEEMLRLATDSANIGTWTRDLSNDAMRWSPRLEEIFGIPRGSFPGHRNDFVALVHPDDRERQTEAVTRAIKDRRDYEVEFRYRHASGEYRWMVGRGRALYDHSGRPLFVAGTAQDITERKEVEAALRRSEEQFRTLANSSPSLIWMSGPDKNCTWFNKAWLEFTGRAMEQELGDGWIDAVHPDDAVRCVETYRSAFDARREFRMEYRLRRHDGVYRWVLDSGVPMGGEGNNFSGYIGSCIDVTDQVLARQTLERQQLTLEEAVRARTAELQQSNERLRLAERMASLGTLSAGLGHDMGNLLVPVRIRLDALSQAGLAAEYQEDVEAIRTSAEYLQRLANGLRMLAVDPSRAPASEPIDLLAWWADAGPLLKNALPRGITLQHSLPTEPCPAAISRAAITQAVFNLVQNAGDAMRARGSGVVRISIKPEGESVQIQVSDNGPGMTPEVKARCMEPFFTTKTRGISTGLGLLLVYGLVRDSGGTIHLESELGVGTTFTIMLPQNVPTASPEAPRKNARVDVRDARLRALITAELKALNFVIHAVGDEAPALDVLIVDNPAHIPTPTPGLHVLLLRDEAPSTPPSPGVVSLGSKPKFNSIREALRRVAKGPAQ